MSTTFRTNPLHRPRTKIVATVGPACRDPDRLRDLVLAGVNVFRLNMAHGSTAEHAATVEHVRRVSKELGVSTAVLVDLAGPKIRLGQLQPDPILCIEGQSIDIVRGHQSPSDGVLVCSYQPLIDELETGDRVMLSDGTVTLEVLNKQADRATCRVISGGEVRSRQGVNLPGVKLSLLALTEDDRKHASWAAEVGADFVSLSFVRRASDLVELKQLLALSNARAQVIAKIEKPEALTHLAEIVQESDGIMVARGDLGVEIDVATMPFAQKRIIDKCSQFTKPVIVATQMLESMVHSRRPTRAEVTDVANAVLDGADACMLSGETAIGKYPREAVATMNRILQASEELMPERLSRSAQSEPTRNVHPITAAVVAAASQISRDVQARLVVIATRSGRTALAKSKLRDLVPTLAVSDDEAVMRQMSLYWGIHPIWGAEGQSGHELREFINRWGAETGALQPGDRVVCLAGTGILRTAHNQLVVHEVE
jgi:pyruvate kinase